MAFVFLEFLMCQTPTVYVKLPGFVSAQSLLFGGWKNIYRSFEIRDQYPN